jgi:hypothetical protein
LFDDAYAKNATSKKIQSQAKAPDFRYYLIIAHNWVLLVEISATPRSIPGRNQRTDQQREICRSAQF